MNFLTMLIIDDISSSGFILDVASVREDIDLGECSVFCFAIKAIIIYFEAAVPPDT